MAVGAHYNNKQSYVAGLVAAQGAATGSGAAGGLGVAA